MFSKFRCAKILPFKDLSDEQEKCSICLSPLNKNKKQIIHLEKCLHSFHSDCIYKWFDKKNTCPCCRTTQNRKRLLISYNRRNRRTKRNVIKDMFKDCIGVN